MEIMFLPGKNKNTPSKDPRNKLKSYCLFFYVFENMIKLENGSKIMVGIFKFCF